VNSFQLNYWVLEIIGIYLIVQAVIGVLAFEYAWYKTKRYREVNEDRDSQYQAFCRLDAKNWSRFKFYPGAVLMMPSRIVLLLIDGMILTFIVTILSFGHDFRKGPMKNGCRKYIIYFAYHVCCSFYLIICGMTTSIKKIDYDYSYYLGPNYKNNMSYLK
jgi:hypothetical protein